MQFGFGRTEAGWWPAEAFVKSRNALQEKRGDPEALFHGV
jgi:hypothetical protein